MFLITYYNFNFILITLLLPEFLLESVIAVAAVAVDSDSIFYRAMLAQSAVMR